MDLTPELIIAYGTLITVVSTAASSWLVNRRSARKDEVAELKKEVEKWRNRYDRLYNYDLRLRLALTQAGIACPEMPAFEESR
jgi:hypothetical protein